VRRKESKNPGSEDTRERRRGSIAKCMARASCVCVCVFCVCFVCVCVLLLLTSDFSPQELSRCDVIHESYKMRKEHFSRRSLMRKHDPHSCVPGNKAHRFIMTESSNYASSRDYSLPEYPVCAPREIKKELLVLFFFTRHVSLALRSLDSSFA